MDRLSPLCFTLEKTLTENRAKLQAADASSLESAIEEGRAAVDKQDDAEIKSAIERLEKEAHRVASAMYQTAPGGSDAAPGATEGAGAAGPARQPATPNVVDAEFDDAPP